MNFFRRIFAKQGIAGHDYMAYPESPPTTGAFSHAAYDDVLARDGVVVFPWLTTTEVDELAAVVASATGVIDYANVHIPTRFWLSAFSNDAACKTRIYDSVSEMLGPRLELLLPDYEPLAINVFEKKPRSGYDPVPVHQNPSFVEEPSHKSFSLWIPLQDVDRSNGTVGVVKGSHNRFNRMRAGNMPHELVFELVEKKLENELFEPLALRKGEALALDDSIIHWSYPNSSDAVRTAVQLIMVPRNVPHIYYYYDDSQAQPMMDLYEVDKNFFFHFNCKARPEGLRHIGRVPYEYRKLRRDELTLADPAG